MLSAAFSADPLQELELDTVSHVTSLPRAPSQHWHRDTVRQLHKGSDESALANAHCVTLFLPLIDVEIENGPTELLLGSHLSCSASESRKISVPDGGGSWDFENECAHTVTRPYKATAEAGAAILFDSRILHRGGANRSERRRPQIYVTWAQQASPRAEAPPRPLPLTLPRPPSLPHSASPSASCSGSPTASTSSTRRAAHSTRSRPRDATCSRGSMPAST